MLADRFAKEVVTAGPLDSLGRVGTLMLEHNVGTVVIVEKSKPVGILTDRDLALALGARGCATDTPSQEVMSKPVTTIHQSKGVFDATEYMMGYEVRRLPIVDDDNRLVGLVSMDDLLQLFGRELHHLAEGIKPEVEVV